MGEETVSGKVRIVDGISMEEGGEESTVGRGVLGKGLGHVFSRVACFLENQSSVRESVTDAQRRLEDC